MGTVSPARCSFRNTKSLRLIRFTMIIEDRSQEYCDEINVDWDESWNDSVLNVYRSDLSALSFGSTVITALFK